MLKFLDRAFWKALAGFVLILGVSFSLLAVAGAYGEFQKGVAALKAAWSSAKD